MWGCIVLVFFAFLLQVLDFHEMSNAGNRLVSALSLVCFLFLPFSSFFFCGLVIMLDKNRKSLGLSTFILDAHH